MRSPAFLCVLLLAFTACSSAQSSALTTHDPSSLQWGVAGISDVPTLDPTLVSDPTSISVASLIYGGLVRLDGRLQVKPDAAKSWAISRDGKTYSFHLRTGLKFAGGNLVTASDFVTALTRSFGSGNSSSTGSTYLQLIATNAKGVPKISSPNPSTVQIVLVHPAAHFLAELAFPASFVPDPSVMARYGDAWTDHAAGFGPYMVGAWRHSRFLRLVPNPNFRPKPAVKSITLRFYAPGDAVAAYNRGDIDLVSGLLPGQSVSSKPAGLQRVRLLALDYLAFNTTRKPFRRTDVRRAFAAVWTPAFVTHAMKSSAFPSDGFLPASFDVGTPLWKPAQPAARYLAAARYPNGHGFPQVTLILPNNAALHALALELRRSWQRYLGVDIAIRQLNNSNYQRVLNARAYDLAFVRWGADYADPQDFLDTQLGPSPDNVTGWAGTSYDRLIPLADSYDPRDPRRLTLFKQAAAIAADRVPLLPMDEPAQTALVRHGLHGVALTPLGTVYISPGKLGFSR